MAGRTDFNRGKFEELIVYIARRLPPEAALGRVKLAKLLLHSDFTAYTRLGHSITGATYEKWEHGHLPRELVRSEKDMQAEGRLREEEVDYYGLTLKHVTSDREPDMAAFTEDEIAIIEGVLRQFGHESATYLSQLSHEDSGWALANDREEIPYETALIGTKRPPESVFEDFRRLHRLAS
jgi:hypothetical protein